MAPVLSLLVHGWVPVGVVEDHTVRTRKVDAHTTTTGGGDEAEDTLVQVETIYQLLTVLCFDRTVKTNINVAVEIEELLENVEHFSHLSKNDTF
jgi:hypothetical protein